MGEHTAGEGERPAGVRAASLWHRGPLPEEWLPRTEGNQVQSLHGHQHRTDLAVQERAGDDSLDTLLNSSRLLSFLIARGRCPR